VMVPVILSRPAKIAIGFWTGPAWAEFAIIKKMAAV